MPWPEKAVGRGTMGLGLLITSLLGSFCFVAILQVSLMTPPVSLGI